MGDLGSKSGNIAGLINGLLPHMAVEIAIGAFREAKRPMHINAETGSGKRMARGCHMSYMP
jgi:hypothetical protein